MQSQNLILVDLDGTLYKCNTFRKYLIWIVKFYFRKFNSRGIKVLFYMGLRFFRLISHRQMKFQVLRASVGLKRGDLLMFIRTLDDFLDRQLIDVVKKRRGYKILSTAAPENYVRLMCEDLFFDEYFATPMPNGTRKWTENIRQYKVHSLNSFLRKKNGSVMYNFDSVFTDHHDDIHLMKMFEKVYLLKPDKLTLKVLDEENIKYTTLN